MTLLRRCLPVLLGSVLMTGCGTSPPPHYYGLNAAAPAPASGNARMLVEILPVSMPERLNREEMVLTDPSGQLDVRDGALWAAPLADEVRQMVADTLWAALGAADVYQAPVAPAAGGPVQYRLSLRIDRFEAQPGRGATVEGSWTVRPLPQGRSATCRAGAVVALPGLSAEAAAVALSDGTRQLAQKVADSIGRLERNDTAACP